MVRGSRDPRRTRASPASRHRVCGCYPQTHPQDAEALDVDLVAGTGDRMRFLDLLEDAAREKEPVVSLDEALRRRTFEVLPAGGLAERTRAMLKVEDGCANFCSYCIIPYARGPVRSLPAETAEEEGRRLAEDVHFREAAGADERQGGGELLLRLPGEAGDYNSVTNNNKPKIYF